MELSDGPCYLIRFAFGGVSQGRVMGIWGRRRWHGVMFLGIHGAKYYIYHECGTSSIGPLRCVDIQTFIRLGMWHYLIREEACSASQYSSLASAKDCDPHLTYFKLTDAWMYLNCILIDFGVRLHTHIRIEAKADLEDIYRWAMSSVT